MEHARLEPGSEFDARSAMDALGEAIAVIAPDWRVRYMNSPWERILGVGSEEAVDSDLWATYPAFTLEPGGEMLRATLADGLTRRYDLEYSAGDERRSYGVRVARDDQGFLVIALSRPFASLGRVRDSVLEERNEENASLRQLARQMAEVADHDELLEILCDAAASQCGADGAAVIRAVNEVDGELVATAGALGPARFLRFALAGSLAQEVLESKKVMMVEAFSESDRPLARMIPGVEIGPMLLAPLGAHEALLGVLVITRDPRSVAFGSRESQRLRVIADHAALAIWKSELLEQVTAADQAKSRFLATISHELRTPLTALTGYEELLVDQVVGPLAQPQMEILERMRSVTLHLSAMIEEVLSYSSIEAGGEVMRPTEFLAADLLGAAAAVVEPLANQKSIDFQCHIVRDPGRMVSDVDKVRQILVNLAGNAIKFTDAGQVRLLLDRDGDHVFFRVRDTGIGIAPADMGRLFRPFSQVDVGLTRRYGGTGLGLYISQRIAGLLGGRISVVSVAGEGSEFTLMLPVGQ